jgi:probable HAF family extracellular repeat protein
MRRYLLPAVLFLSILLSTLATAQAATYTFTTIDVPGSIQTNANGINSRGQIVGFYTDASSGTSHGFLDDNGTVTTLDFPGAINNVAFGINKDGKIVGGYAGAQHAFFCDQSMFTVPDPPQSDPLRLATRINDTLQIVGFYGNQSGRHGFLYDHSTFTIIDVPFAGALHTQAFGINNLGQIVGIYVKPNGEYGGFLAKNGMFTPIDVTLPGAHNTVAYDINLTFPFDDVRLDSCGFPLRLP